MVKPTDTKEKILITASKLFQKQGYHGTGLNQIIKESGCPKGSLYYYFPEGKEQLVEEAIWRAKEGMRKELTTLLAVHDDARNAIDYILTYHEKIDVTAEYDGIPLALIAMETSLMSERIRLACKEAYDLMIELVAQKFIASKWPQQEAVKIATLLIAILQGYGIMAMTHLSNEPFLLAHQQILTIITQKERELIAHD